MFLFHLSQIDTYIIILFYFSYLTKIKHVEEKYFIIIDDNDTHDRKINKINLKIYRINTSSTSYNI